jgi:TonB family protein
MLLIVGGEVPGLRSGNAFADGVAQTDQARDLAQASELSTQVVKLYNEKRFEEAIPLAHRAIEIRQRILPAGDFLIGSAFYNLGVLYLAIKKDSEAEKILQSALSVYELHPEQHPLMLSDILDGLAYIRVRKHDFERAATLLLRSIAIQEKHLGPTNSRTIEAMKDYACINLKARTGKDNLLGDDKDKSTKALRTRAMCWLGGWKDNCADEVEIQTEDVLNGKAIRLVQPSYPVEARSKRLSGHAFVAIMIDEAGNVINAKSVCGGYVELNAASVNAARLSKFTSTKVDQKPVRVTGLIVYNFVAQ